MLRLKYLFTEEPNAEDVIDNSRRAEHASAIVAMDSSSTLRVFCTCRLEHWIVCFTVLTITSYFNFSKSK